MRYSSIIIILFFPLLLSSQTVQYSPLIQGGGLDTSDLGSYINSLYLLSISIAALLATIKLIIAGAKYMLSDVVTSQGEAKKEIQSALLGLLLVVSAVLILTIINPRLITNELNITRVAPTNALNPSTPTQTSAAATAAASFSGNSCGASSTGPDPTDPQYEVIIEDYTLCPSQNMGNASTLARDCRQKPNGAFSVHGDKIVCRYLKQNTTPPLPTWGTVINTAKDNPIDFSIFLGTPDFNIQVAAQKAACEKEPNFGSWPNLIQGTFATCSLPDVIKYPGNDHLFRLDCSNRNGTYRPTSTIAYCTGCLGLATTCSYKVY